VGGDSWSRLVVGRGVARRRRRRRRRRSCSWSGEGSSWDRLTFM